MRGSIVLDKRNADPKRPRYRIVIEERDPMGNRRRRFHSDPATGSAFTSKRAAEAHLTSLMTTVNAGTYVSPAKDTFGSWLDVWLDLMRPNLKPSTYASYERMLRVHVRPRLGHMPMQRITPVDLDRMYAAMLAGGRSDHREGEGLSPTTVRNCATVVSHALKDAMRKGLIPRNPADLADPPKSVGGIAPGAVKAWTPEHLWTFLEATAGQHYGPVWAFLAATGCRRGEALGLRWIDVDLERGRAAIMQTVQKVDGQVVYGGTKTKAGRRAIALDAATVALLKAQRTRQLEERLAIGPGWTDTGLVFTGATGQPFYPETVTRSFKSEVDRLGLPSIPLHGLRHTHASIALAAGISPKVMQERLGHAKVSITLDIYTHVAPSMHEDAAEEIAALVRAGKR